MSQSTIGNRQSKILFQYCRRVKVLVAVAGIRLSLNLAAAFAAAVRVRNSP